LLEVTGGKERIKYYLDTFNTGFQRPENFDDFVAGLHKSKTKHYMELLNTGAIPLRPGVKRIFEEARAAGLRLAIATTTTPENVTALLANTLGPEGESWFEVIAAGDIVPAKKPAPDIYVYAMEQMRLPAYNCIAFEDSENGIRSSVGAGLKTIITTNDYTQTHNFGTAALVLNSFGEPHAPFTVLQGEARGKSYLDLELIQRIHNR
ncbi:MAG: HAD-IA family hydrolase, partial [Gammaproteobacteria bacterium]|nr:HAD-IA family hydrolase [Gammaproteobacteria bacterium]